MSKNLSQIITKYKVQAFWDVPLKSIDCEKHKFFIIERILQCGGLEGIQWIFDNYGWQSIKQVVMDSRFLSKRTAHFWAVYFSIPISRIRCLSKPTPFPTK
ncbi:MAG: hypothetical protein SCARUB_04192 [Candidatus Scalindua rubra]|uniref:DUF6922 domain-containing protein n=1 Tax=Candidatus Scalindua rubra TaxID=1872076 RepID=A0A1E3X4Z6_9BACT|nr:MAG: hypothetical protein SCARUB_04192 [Candidatus Scalindua rubra]